MRAKVTRIVHCVDLISALRTAVATTQRSMLEPRYETWIRRMTGTATLKTANRHVFCKYAVLTISYYFWTQSLLIRWQVCTPSTTGGVVCRPVSHNHNQNHNEVFV